MQWPTCIFWANLTPFSLQTREVLVPHGDQRDIIEKMKMQKDILENPRAQQRLRRFGSEDSGPVSKPTPLKGLRRFGSG